MKQQLTKNAMEASLIKLLEDRPFEKITVKDIVEDCGLTRTTFYNYYDDIFDIIDGLLRREVEGLVTAAQTSKPWTETVHDAISLASKNPKIIRHLFQSPKAAELKMVFSRAVDTLVDHEISAIVGDGTIDSRDRKLIRDLSRYGLKGLITEWLSSNMKYPLEDEIMRAVLLFEDSVKQAIERGSRIPRKKEN